MKPLFENATPGNEIVYVSKLSDLFNPEHSDRPIVIIKKKSLSQLLCSRKLVIHA